MTPERYTLLRQTLMRRQPTLTVLMENVHKQHNYAAVLRNCDAVGVLESHAIASRHVLCRDPSVSASASKWVDVNIHQDTNAACDHLHAQGFKIYSADLNEKSVDFRELDYTQPVALLLGAERKGVSDVARSRVDGSITIPMLGIVESLNVSVACAVVLFEAQRQRQAAGMYDRCQLAPEPFRLKLFEWLYPQIAEICRRRGVSYPDVDQEGEIVGTFPRG